MRIVHCFITLLISTCFLSHRITAHSKAQGPLHYLSRVENPTVQAPSYRVHAFSTFDLEFTLHRRNQRVRLSLEPNHDVLADDAHVEYLDRSGNVKHTERIDRREHRVFQGDARVQHPDGSWSTVGWARIFVQRDGIDPLFEGAFSVLGDHHHILLRSRYMSTKHDFSPDAEDVGIEYMVVFRDSDIGDAHGSELKRSSGIDRSCSADSLSYNTDPQHPVFKSMLERGTGSWRSMSLPSLFGKRQIDSPGIPGGGGNSGGVNLRLTIGQTAGCPTTRKVALIGVATDCTYTKSFGSTNATRSNIIQLVNSASGVYERTFNITLGLRNLTISDAECPGAPAPATPWNNPCGNATVTDRLNEFSQWRGR